MSDKILDQLNLEPFVPARFLSHPLAQTIIPYYLPHAKSYHEGRKHYVELPDGDRLALQLETPVEWKNGDKIVVLIHGLAGCQDSSYIKRIGKKFFEKNALVVKVNLRTCGPGRGLAWRPYHSGRSEDTFEVITWLQKKFSKSPIFQIGFSLSANITIKMLGESYSDSLPQLEACVAVSPPLDLKASAHKITKLSYGLFDKFFMHNLHKTVELLKKDFPDKHIPSVPPKSNMIDFDNLFTAPMSGFEDGDDYYQKASGKQFVEKIKLPTLILHSVDDPVVESRVLVGLNRPANVDLIETQFGGHVGFLSNEGHWMDKVILSWVLNK